MSALRKQRDRPQQFGNLAIRVTMAKYWQPERRLGDEYREGRERERGTGGIGEVLVAAGGKNAQAIRLDRAGGGAEHRAGGVLCEGDPADINALAVAESLG